MPLGPRALGPARLYPYPWPYPWPYPYPYPWPYPWPFAGALEGGLARPAARRANASSKQAGPQADDHVLSLDGWIKFKCPGRTKVHSGRPGMGIG